MRRLFIVRHGNTFDPGQPLRRVGLRTDIPLVQSGHAQANALGAWFCARRIGFDHVLSGRLMRTRQTAEAIMSASPDPRAVDIADFLNEIDHGPDENALEEDVVARLGQETIAAWDERAEAPDGWIINRDARIAAWRSFLADTTPGNILLVTSNGAARFALLAAGVDLTRQSLKLRTGAYGEIELTGPDQFTIVRWDQRPPA